MKRSSTILVLAIAIAALAAAGCGGDGDSGKDADKPQEQQLVPGLETVRGLEAAREDGSVRLQWEPRPNAETYRVAVRGSDDQGLWAGEVQDISIDVPRYVVLPERGATWIVSAIDDEGHAIAVSEPATL